MNWEKGNWAKEPNGIRAEEQKNKDDISNERKTKNRQAGKIFPPPPKKKKKKKKKNREKEKPKEKDMRTVKQPMISTKLRNETES